MDFGTLISVAQKNEGKKQPTVPCYQTKFTPLKKQSKQSKTLSDNIKKFLARKEEEERQKALKEKRKKENLLALRDQKTQNRINKHLKVCKAANKSVIEDAIDSENTAITIAGPSQPDEDDYGYESQAASALYNQLMNKYNSLPPEKPLFSASERTVKDIASTKDRVKQALKQQELEESSGHRKKRKSNISNIKETEIEEKVEKNNKEINNKVKEVKENKDEKLKVKEDKDEKPKVKKKLSLPPIGFAELLKLAEVKQHEPVVLEVKPKVENERPMTKRQKIEHIQEKERKEQREKKDLEANKKTSTSSKLDKTQVNRIPKANEKSVISNSTPNKTPKCTTTVPKQITDKFDGKYNIEKPNSNKSSFQNELLEERKKLEAERRQLEEMRRAIEEEKKKLVHSKNKIENVKSEPFDKLNMTKSKSINKQISKDIKSRQYPPSDLKLQSTLANIKPKQFPPSDVRSTKSNTVVKKVPNKRRICDDEEDYSDLIDFIDDEPEENEEDYSKHISEIFGYDKSKYRNIDDDDDTAMESNFAQQLKEEYISSKIGYMEDLEDMRMEALEKKRKAISKKRTMK
ncbi:PREDICTED: protein SPT2 homolog [Trachymyrmex cornetzi]|uniref:Protein SPT2 homolog n=1 Tax=Trachymyrmex cornetzi TaxID=471704 RepID=A0A195EC57_9HYME|nr:PREDICTED: protein SPT2 homolog [Trachymyrmex cornetzi]KYN22808.1 Protein SPT2 like protein [Trachymyrmex cornetzi]